MYFISEVLSDSKTRYPQIQKLLYVVLIAKRKLHHYFKSHSVMVVTSFPLGVVVQNRDAIGRIVKWALKLMGQGISYAPRTAIKSQVLAYFIIEWTKMQMSAWGWSLFRPLEYMVHIHFPTSNNVVEYEALINGQRIDFKVGIRWLDI